ncbi:MAG: guanylate kinase [Nitrospirae bacterium]|nr:MAG: guanylate kinase [Nitrospirota bacterium]
MQQKTKGSIFIISAPSGAGKTTLCRKVMAKLGNIVPSVSYTTREPRTGEVQNVDYTFVSHTEFRKMIGKGDFVEWAEVHGNLYGTSKKRLEKLMASGVDVLLDIDTQGARQIKDSYDGGVFIFILPPSLTVLGERLKKRMSNTRERSDDIQRRLSKAEDEIKDYDMYDYVIINDELTSSLRKFEAVITAERLSSSKITMSWIKRNIFR